MIAKGARKHVNNFRRRFHNTLHYHLCLLPNTNTGTLPSARTSDV
jgi:hypothetical protein